MPFNAEEDLKRLLQEQQAEHLYDSAYQYLLELYQDDLWVALSKAREAEHRNTDVLKLGMIVRFRKIAWTVIYVNESRARICKVGGDETNRKDCEDCAPTAEFEVLYDPTKDDDADSSTSQTSNLTDETND